MDRTVRALGCVLLVSIVLAARPGAAQTPDGTLYFNDDADSIRIDGQTTFTDAATFEAWVYFPDGTTENGRLYTEWLAFVEDKDLAVGPTFSFGFAYPTSGGTVLSYAGPISTGEWHHVAFVHSGEDSTQRLYVDGALVASQGASAQINNGEGPGTIGALHRDGSVNASFRGFLDSVRLSTTARYEGESFTVPPRDLPPDASALVVYHFDAGDFYEEEGRTRIEDLSGNERDGTLAFGFAEASAPAAPALQGDLDCTGTLTATDALKDLRASVGSAVSQDEPCPDAGERLTTGLFGDVDCSGTLTAGDALKVLRVSVGLTVEQEAGCPAFLAAV